MRSITRRAFVGVILTYRALAVASIGLLLQRAAAFGVVPVCAEHPRRGELAELVPDHGLGDEHRHVLAAVVDGDGVPDHLRHDRGTARPRADDALVAAAVHLPDLLREVNVDERPLLDAPGHALAPSLPAPADDLLVGGLALLPGPALLLAPRARGVAAARGLALAAAHRMVNRVHGDAPHRRPLRLPPSAAGLPELHELVLGVADLADGGLAVGLHEPHLAGGKPERGEASLLGDELHARAGGARSEEHTSELQSR